MKDVEAVINDPNMTDEDHYMTTLVETEVERVKFLARNYIRTRIQKVRACAHFLFDPKANLFKNQRHLDRRLCRVHYLESRHAIPFVSGGVTTCPRVRFSFTVLSLGN